MKKMISVFTLLFFSLHINAQQKEMTNAAVTSVEFESVGRRGRTEIKITRDSMVLTTRTGKKVKAFSQAQWNKLLNTVEDVDLSMIHTLVSPTHQRDVDGALHCRFFISTATNRYETQHFDSGKPMKQLQSLYDCVEMLVAQMKK
jgi:hypothetical protein